MIHLRGCGGQIPASSAAMTTAIGSIILHGNSVNRVAVYKILALDG